ncbi:MAG: bifunctional (p)ppGpp synthetase/guanosine-3',5'-bis(diphosphate) 3'-pyrophosphohydrolase [Chloroflexi bacterium]|nr:bifunctional (p)ppGpp synthetase/guanosine-3',5'-bis(diphosphate) 3'-pyrophosphohydrolase [Chloroflexota bacterium]
MTQATERDSCRPEDERFIEKRFQSLMAALPSSYTYRDRALVERAFRFAREAHRGQRRSSGEPYVIHCIEVAKIVADLYPRPEAIAAALLHDVVEDTPVTLDQLRVEFGEDIARFVDGVTKLSAQLPRVSRTLDEDESDDARRRAQQRRRALTYANIRKMILAMLQDPEVIFIKLADRLHNMRTLAALSESRQRRIAQETLNIFAPLANRLGIWKIKWELEDLSMRYLEPEEYKRIAKFLRERRSQREKMVQKIVERVHQVLQDQRTRLPGFENFEFLISGRPKHIYSIWRKMQRKNISLEQVMDLRGVRIIVKPKDEFIARVGEEEAERQATGMCYTLLGVIHSQWRPMPGEFDDYIANPKDNQYQSLHTTVMFEDNRPLEVQIRTQQMHDAAELGLAAHWRYKEAGTWSEDWVQRWQEAMQKVAQGVHPQPSVLARLSPEERAAVQLAHKIQWFRQQLVEWQREVGDEEFVDGVKTDVFADRIFVYTPKGDIIDLPKGATPIDFAYKIHTEVGHRCRGARVNGRIVPLNYKLKSGDLVEIITGPRRGGPSLDWLNPELGYVVTQRARAKIRQWFRKQDRQRKLEEGQRILHRALQSWGLSRNLLTDDLARELGYSNLADLYVAIGGGEIEVNKVAEALWPQVRPQMQEESEEDWVRPSKPAQGAPRAEQGKVQIDGLMGMKYRLARCCNPVPGEPIVGYVTSDGRGVSIHRADCPTALNLKAHRPERFVQVRWSQRANHDGVVVRLHAHAVDRKGLLRDITGVIASEDSNIVYANVKTQSKGKALVELALEIRDLRHLNRLLFRLAEVENVYKVYRVGGKRKPE